MSSTSFQELAALHSVLSEQACTQPHSASESPTAAPSCEDTGQAFLATTTSKPLTLDGWTQTEFPLMPSPAASRARTSATPASAPAWKETDRDSGFSSPVSLASWDQTSRSWRTSQRCLIEGWELFSERFPTSGTMQFGTLSPHAPWDTHMCDDECSLWPTPTASMDGRGFGIPLHENTGRYKLSTVLRVHALVKEHGWRIHPSFTEALMGFPSGWSEIEASETLLPRPSRKRSGEQS